MSFGAGAPALGMEQSNAGPGRPIVKALFAASCLLSFVSWYTTYEGMALYLSVWFALLASVGIQLALVMVAWLAGFSPAMRSANRRALLITVYAVTAMVSITFSYVSLYRWFSAHERPAEIERKLYDALNGSAEKARATLTSAIDEQQKHVLALQDMTEAEKTHGRIARAQDADPYLADVRAAVAKEAQTYEANYKEGAGEGVRYSAFDRYTKLAQQALDRMQQSARDLDGLRTTLKPLDPSDKQIVTFRQAYDSIPWNDVEQALHSGRVERVPPPAYGDYVDKSASTQEDLLIAFNELFTAPTPRHIFALALAAFIDVIIFLLAFASGPYFFGSTEERWLAAGAALDGLDTQIFARDFLRKFVPGPRGIARVDAASLAPGEQQFCLLMVQRKQAVLSEEDGRQVYYVDRTVHEQLMESIAAQHFPLRAAATQPAK